MSSNSDNSGFVGIFMIVVYIVAWVGTGTLAWNWVEPESFWGAIKFLIVWGIFGYIAQLIGMAIFAGIASMND